VQQTSGRPGAVASIVLRGGTGYDGVGSPLVIVDGFLRSGFSEINQDDIASIEVLKDASATAIYGARANNGVVLITTKKGKEGVSEISFQSKAGINKLNNPFNFLDAGQYIDWSRRAIVTSGLYEPSRLTQLNGPGPFGTGNIYKDLAGNYYDGNVNSSAVWSTMFLDNINKEKLAAGWQVMKDPVPTNASGVYDPAGTYKDIIYKNFNYADYALKPQSLTQDYNVAMTGGNDKGKYYSSLGYYTEKGMPINTFYNRLTFLFNAEYKLKPWLTSTSSLNFADAKWRDPALIGEGDYLGRMLGAPPTLRGVNEKGDLLIGRAGGDGNPAVYDRQLIRNNNTDKFTLNQALKVDFAKTLSLKVSANAFYDEGLYESFNKDYLSGPNSINTSRSSSANFGRNLSQTYNAVLNYNETFATKHSLSAMIGSEYYDIYSKGLSASGSGAPTDDFMDLNLTNSDKDRRAIDSYHNRRSILSFFSRVNYDYNQKYLLSLTVRRDGYSTLIDNRWGTFPGVSVGWNAHNEDFLKPYFGKVLNKLKVRASYGVNGNVSNIGAYELQGSYGTARYDGSVGYNLTGLPFPNLRWEKSQTAEVGLEATLFNRVDFTAAYYKRQTEDKISSFVLPATAGITSLTTNNGSMQNQGVELDINYRVLSNHDWSFSVSANTAFNRNKIIKLPYNGLPNNRQGGYEVYDATTGLTKFVGGYQEGQDPNIAYAYVANGLYRTQADLDAINPAYKDLQGNRVLLPPYAYNLLTVAQKASYFPIALGDVQWADLNGDNIIDYKDRAYMGRTKPSWTGGFGTYLKYKQFSLSTRWDYALGFVQFDGPRTWFLGNMQGSFNTTTDVLDTYTPQNTNAQYPTYYWADQLYKNNLNRGTSMLYKKGDYLALREVNLSYSLPKNIARKIKSENITFNITGQNLTYFSQSTLFSPEVYGGQGIGGSSGYPLPRTIIFGAKFTF
jgi:TonB-linked SusC/RagA family outer membrane protein